MNLDALLRIKADVQGENNIRRLGNSLQGVQGKAKNLQMSFGALSGAVKGFAAVLTAGAFSAFVKQGIDMADAIGKASARTGVAADQLVSFQNAAALADVSNEQLVKGLTKLNINMVSAAEGNAQLNKRFEQLGVTIKNQDGTLKDTSEVFKELADRFKDMPNGAQKAAAAMTIFGKSGVDLITLLNGGSASLDEFTYKLSDEFSSRAEYFNDSITKLGFKTQGFQMQLMDALLPALQSILDVFADLFATDNDWTALFDVIKFGLRGVATVIYSTVALFGSMARGVVGAFEVVAKAVKGDFAGAWNTFNNVVSAQVSQAKRDFANLQRLWTDAAAPAGGVGRRGFNMQDDAAQRAAAAEAKRQQDAADRAAKKALDDYNRALLDASKLAEDLTRKTRDLGLETQRTGATARQTIDLDYKAALNDAADQADDLAQKITDLSRATGGQVQFEGLKEKAREYLAALEGQAATEQSQALIQLYKDETKGIEEATAAAWEFARANQYNNDILGGLKDGLQGYIDQLGTMREAVTNLAQGAFRGLEDALVSLVTTGTANFREFARSVLEATSRMIIQQLILKTIMSAIGGIGGGGGGGGGDSIGNFNAAASQYKFAMGGVMTPNGPMPLRRYAAGGIANSPQLALYGEGSMPEAYVPLPDGRRIPVAMQGGGGASVTVNVDAKGTKVAGDDPRSNQLGSAIAQAVQNELIKQKRPGGLLAVA